MNLTISIDDDTLRRAREVARQRGVSLQQLLRQYLAGLAGVQPPEAVADELLALMDQHGGRSGGRRSGRSEAYDGRS